MNKENVAPDFKYCWKCQKFKQREFFTESRWESESNSSLCASCACDLEAARYSNDSNYRELKKKRAKDNYNKEEARIKKQEYRKRVKENGGRKLRNKK